MSDFCLSLLAPLHNEEPNIPELVRRSLAVLDQIEGGPHELLLVNDGSTDATLELLRSAAAHDARVKVISLSRNFGHQAALSAGLDHVTGDATVIIDGDLQDPPESIPLLLEQFRQGYDVVYARRIARKEPLYLRACYWLYYRLAASLSEIELPLDAGDFGLMSRRVVQQLCGFREQHRYLRGLRSWVGFRQIGIAVERDERAGGRTKYSPWKLLKLAADGLFAFSVVPIRAAAVLGLIAVGLSVLFALYSTVAKFVLPQIPRGFTALTVLITFLSGMNLLFLGVIGEYIGRIYDETKSRPLYVVAEVIQAAQGAPKPAAVSRAASAP
jgi:polyisoprenyl-phosphate glycosyltransferase